MLCSHIPLQLSCPKADSSSVGHAVPEWHEQPKGLRSGHHVEHISSIVAPKATRCSDTAISLGKAPVPLRLRMAVRTSLSHSGALHLLCRAVLLHQDKLVSGTTCNSSLPKAGKETFPPHSPGNVHFVQLQSSQACFSKLSPRMRNQLCRHNNYFETRCESCLPNLQGNHCCDS